MAERIVIAEDNKGLAFVKLQDMDGLHVIPRIRELQHVLEGAMVRSVGMILPERLPLSYRSNVAVPAGAALPLADALERAGIPFPERVVYVQAQVRR